MHLGKIFQTAEILYDVEVTAPDGGVNMRCGAGVEYDKVLPDMIPNGTVLIRTQGSSGFQ